MILDALFRRAVQFLVIAFAAMVLIGIAGFVVEALGDEVHEENQATCFLRKRLGGLGRLRQRGQRAWIQRLDGLVRDATRDTPFTPGLVLAISFHESSWRPTARGRDRAGNLREFGLMQIMPERLRAAGLREGENPLDPVVNLRLGVETLRQCHARPECEGDRGRIVQCYARGNCGSPDSFVRLMLRWADQADACGS